MHTTIAEFVADLKLMGRGPRTIEGHELELRRLGRWLEENGLAWDAVTRRQLQEYARLRADLGFSSRSNMFCSLRVFYKWAVEQGYVALSPAAGFKTPVKPKPVPRALNRPQVRTLVQYLDELGAAGGRRAVRDRALLLTALYAGLRAAELAALRWPAVDLAEGVITIRLSKMNHGRSVPIHPALAEVLTSWREVQGGAAGWPVFSLDGEGFNPNRVGKIARRVSEICGVKFTAHTLRHSFATWALRGSGNLYAVSKMLGHSQVAQTEIYLSAAVDDLRDALGRLPGIGGW